MSPESKTHRIAVLKQDNGELQEDVVERPVEGVSGDDVRSDRVVHSTTMEDVAERSHPAEAVPGTLPRSGE